MANKITDAATRVRRAMQNNQPARGLDVWLLASEWLTEHPVDDGDPVDNQWLESVGFVAASPNSQATRRELHGDTLKLIRWADGEWCLYDLESGDGFTIPTPTARGEARRLFACLGLPIGGDQ